jgi:AcrR family transcriptional regulator
MDPHACKRRVADVALDRLQAEGLAGFALEGIARAAGLPEADVRACFGDLEDLIAHLVAPLVSRLEELAASAAAGDLRRADEVRQVIEGYFDAVAAHPTVAGLAVGHPAGATSPAFGLVRDSIRRLRTELAGGAGADLDHRIRAASALAAVQSAVLDLTGVERSTLRTVVTEAAIAVLLSAPGTRAGLDGE